MAEVMDVSGSVTVPHKGIGRGDRVRLLIDGHINAESIKDTAHKGTEYKFTVRAETALLLRGEDYERFDSAIAELQAAQGEEDPRQGHLSAVDGDGESESGAEE